MGALDNVQIRLVDSLDEAFEFKRWMSGTHGVIACDTETRNLNAPWSGNKIRLIQIGDANSGWAIPWEDWGGVAKEILRAYDGRILFHNVKFDLPLINHTEKLIDWSQVDDTRTLAWLHDPVHPTGLKPLADRFVDKRASAAQSQLDDAMAMYGWTWETVPVTFEPYWAYGALDTVLTCRIWDEISKAHPSGDTVWKAYELELGVLPVLSNMERRGACVDVEYAMARQTEFLARANQLKEWAETEHGIVITSGAQFARRIIELGGEGTLVVKTKTGAWCTDKDVVALLMVHPNEHVRNLAAVKQEVTRLLKLSSAYLSHVVDYHIDGRIHASINPLQAKTSRMSISGAMSLQNLPRANKKNMAAIEVRNCFVPSPGNKLAMCDYDQVELRLTGHYSRDPQILEILRDPSIDPFTEFAKLTYNDDAIVKSDPRRAITKSATYANLYGAGVSKFSATAGIPESEGEAFMRSFYSRFPGIERFKNDVAKVAEMRLKTEGTPYVTTPFGHRIAAESHKTYALVNYLIQGTAANIMKKALVDLDNAGLGEFLVLPIHDEVIVDAPEAMIADVMHEVADIMADHDTFLAPLPVGAEGPFDRWGHKYLQKD